MSAKTRRKRSKISGQFSPRPVEMNKSFAFRVLSLSAHRVFARIEIELADHGGNDNGKLPVTYIDFMEYGLDRHAIGPAIAECEALGFIEVTERGRSGNAEFRKPSLYRLTYRYTNDAPPTDEWRAFTSIEDAQAAATVARKSSIERSRRKRDRQLVPLKEVAA